MAKSGYVYFLHAVGTDRVKIGRTRDLVQHMRKLEYQKHAFPLRLLWVQMTVDMQEAKRLLHQRYQVYRVYREWFAFPQDLLASFYDQQPLGTESESAVQPIPDYPSQLLREEPNT